MNMATKLKWINVWEDTGNKSDDLHSSFIRSSRIHRLAPSWASETESTENRRRVRVFN